MIYQFERHSDAYYYNKRINYIFSDLYPTAVDYIENPEKYICKYVVSINSKKRHIVTYRDGDYGIALRNLHYQFIKTFMELYVSSPQSFAYKKKHDIVSCLNQHLMNDTFLKADIHSYFDSISYENTLRKIKPVITKKAGKTGEANEILATILKACFYEDKLPIGFRSSPIISDFYLNAFDKEMAKIDGVKYTRYADDFIISAKGKNAENLLAKTKETLIENLEKENLELNLKKTYIRKLKQPGDAIHVLGLNIVKSNKVKNRITVSDRYIRKTCRDLCDLMSKSESLEKAELKKAFAFVNGEISFIEHSSKDSYEKLKKMFRIKSGLEISIAGKDLAVYLHADDYPPRKEEIVNLTVDNLTKIIGYRETKRLCNVESIFIPSTVTKFARSPFVCCKKLESITVDESSELFCDIDGVLFTKDMTELIAYPINKKGSVYEIPEGVRIIRAAAFSRNENLEKVIMPNSVEIIRYESFVGCAKLREVYISDNVKDINQSTFWNCASLQKVKLPSGLKHIYWLAFCDCKNLTQINIPKSTTVDGSAFWRTPLESVFKNGQNI